MVFILVLGVVLTPLSVHADENGRAAPFPFGIKQGAITRNETWEGKVILIGDVRIAGGVTVTVAPGTWIIFNDSDVHNLEKDPATPELIVDGTLRTPQPPASRAELLSVRDKKVDAFLKAAAGPQGMEIVPQEVALRPLRDQWRDYKHQYSIGWILVYALLFVL